MTELAWGTVGQRFYEAGTDRGVLYVGGVGVPWNGLKSVNETPSGGDPNPYYLDGIKYLNLASAEEFEATIEAFSSPIEFAPCDGSLALYAGLFITQQPRQSFSMSYRTLVGNDIDGIDLGYKLHLVYNLLVQPSQRNNATTSATIEPITLSWQITATPPAITGFKPTAHMIVDSRTTSTDLLNQIEEVLYGTEITDPGMISVNDLINLYSGVGQPT